MPHIHRVFSIFQPISKCLLKMIFRNKSPYWNYLKSFSINDRSRYFRNFSSKCGQGLIQKDKVHIDCEKGDQIRSLFIKIETQCRASIIIKESLSKLYITFFFFFFFNFLVIMFTLCWWFDQKTRIAFNRSFCFT